jgi:putative tricarboxylic transport membrane protein
VKRPYQITAVICALFAAFVAYESLDMELYFVRGPGPGFFPWWLSLVFGFLAVLMFYYATFRPVDPMPEDFFPTRSGYLRMAAIIGSLAGTLVLFEPLGFRLTTFLFFLFLLSVLGRHGLVLTTVFSLAGSFGVYEVFVRFLDIPLPIGFLGV